MKDENGKEIETKISTKSELEIRSNSPDFFRVYKRDLRDLDEEASETSASISESDSDDSPDLHSAKELLASNIFKNHLKKLSSLQLLENLDLKVTLSSLDLAVADTTGLNSNKFATPIGNLELTKVLGKGNFSRVYAANFNGDAENWVVKALNFKTQNGVRITQKEILKIIIERNLLRRDKQEAHIFYDPKSKQVYLLMPKAKGIEAVEVFKDLVKEIKAPNASYAERRNAFANTFRVLEQILTRLDEFNTRTKHLHGDAHFGNVFVDITEGTAEVPEYAVSMIDYGGCCPINISTKEYISLFSPLKYGDDFTAPELPVIKVQSKNRPTIVTPELGQNITEKADLHSIVGNFVRNVCLELLDDYADKSLPIFEGTKIDDLVQEFMQWSMTYCCNSDKFINMLGPDCTSARLAKQQRNKLLVEMGKDISGSVNSLPIRNNFGQARAMIQLFVEELAAEREKEGNARHPGKGI